MAKRRSILKGMASIFPLGLLSRTSEAAVEVKAAPARDYFKELGVTPFILVIDQLHTLNMGVLQRFCQELTRIMFICGVWCGRAGRQQQEWLDLSLVGLRSEPTA